MIRQKLFLLLLVVAFPLLLFADKRDLTPDDRFALIELSDVQISPDEKWIAYVASQKDLKEDKTFEDIYMVPLAGGEPIQLTNHKESDNHPRWSPDNRYLGFLSKRKEKRQVFLLNRNGGEAVQLTDFQSEVQDFEWSPDGKKLALIVTDPDPGEQKESRTEKKDKEKTLKPHVITRLQIKQDEIGYLNELRNHLYVFDLETKKHKQLTSGPYDDSTPRWSPDGKHILFVSNRTADPDTNRNSDLFLVLAEGGDLKKLTSNPGTDQNPQWSNDGKWIVYEANLQPDLIWYDTFRLAMISADGGEAKIITSDVDRNCFQPSFSSDGKHIFFLYEDQGTLTLAKWSLQQGIFEKNITGAKAISSYSVSDEGVIAFVSSKPDRPNEIFAVLGGQTEQKTHLHTKLLEEVRMPLTEKVRFSSKDGTPVEAFVHKPPDFSTTKKYPLILWIHGGPASQYQEDFSFQRLLFAAKGYVVVAPNPRGSTGYGEKFCKAIWADWGNKDYEDVMAAVEYVVNQGYIDQQKMGVGGWSYGGILTNYVITKTDRFAAAISGAAESNYIANYGTDHYQYEWEKEIGLPWEKWELYINLSPFSRIQNVKTPTLLLVGEVDWNVPALNSEQMYQALRRRGIETMLIVYPKQSHSIEKPSYLKDRDQRYLAWFGHYLKGEKNKIP